MPPAFPIINMRIAITFIAAAAAYLGLLATGHGIINHLPEASATAHIERQADALNEILGSQFAGVAAFPYWDHVGMVGMGSGIYLGEGRVLTSAHVGCFPFRAHDGSIYQPSYSSWRVLKNANGSKSDLAVFEIEVGASSSLAKLAALPIATSHADRPVVLLGTGYTQGAQPITLGSQGKTLAVLGYRVQAQRGTAWGINRSVEALDRPIATGGSFSTRCFTTRFERNEFAGQAAEGDSGGAAFSFNKELNRWELSGCIIAVSQVQPKVTFGVRTFIGDIGFYAPQLAGAEGQVAQQPDADPALEVQAAAIR